MNKENNILPLFGEMPTPVRIVYTVGGKTEACPASVESAVRRLRPSAHKPGDVIRTAFAVFTFYKYDEASHTYFVGV